MPNPHSLKTNKVGNLLSDGRCVTGHTIVEELTRAAEASSIFHPRRAGFHLSMPDSLTIVRSNALHGRTARNSNAIFASLPMT